MRSGKVSENTTSVYRRIEANIFYTRLLLVALAVLLAPVFLFLSQYLALWITLIVLPIGTTIGWRALVALYVTAGSILLALTLIRVKFVASTLPSRVGAVAALEGTSYDIKQRIENLCLSVGLSPPHLYILPGHHRNAFTTGTEPSNTTIVLTEGLIESLSPSELDSVIAHELAHILNRDTLINSTVAGIFRTFRVPLLVYILFWGAAIEAVRNVSFSETWEFFLQSVNYVPVAGSDEPPKWLTILSLFVAWYCFPTVLTWPFLAGLVQSRISRRRQYLADAEAVTITRNPDSLKRALQKLYDRDQSTVAVDAPSSLFGLEHLCILPPFHRVMSRMFLTHPPLEARIHALEKMGPGEPKSHEETSTTILLSRPDLINAAELRRRWVFVTAAVSLIALSVGIVFKIKSSRQEGMTVEHKSGSTPAKPVEADTKRSPHPAREATPPAAETTAPMPSPATEVPTSPPAAGSEIPMSVPAVENATEAPVPQTQSSVPTRTPAVGSSPPVTEPGNSTPTPAVNEPTRMLPPAVEHTAPTPAPAPESAAPTPHPAPKPVVRTPKKDSGQRKGAGRLEISPQ